MPTAIPPPSLMGQAYRAPPGPRSLAAEWPPRWDHRRMRRLTALLAAGLVVSVVAASCGRAEARREPADSPRAASSSDATISPQADRRLSSPLPEPDAWIPRAPDRLAPALDATTRSLRSAIDRWTTEGDVSSGEAPLDVQLLALYQQRIYRMLARDPALADDVVARLSSSVAKEARINVVAGSNLLSLASPVSRPSLIRTQPPEPAGVLLGFYREAEDRFAVAWQVLAAVNYTESKFGRVVSASLAGAQGPISSTGSIFATEVRAVAGSQNSTVVPQSGRLWTLHQPPASSARSRMEDRPRCPGAELSTCGGVNPTPSSRISTLYPPSSWPR